jgi:hypothetical protein
MVPSTLQLPVQPMLIGHPIKSVAQHSRFHYTEFPWRRFPVLRSIPQVVAQVGARAIYERWRQLRTGNIDVFVLEMKEWKYFRLL